MRTDHEALLVLHRPGPEFLVLLRAPAGQGYWHLVSGGVESGEEPGEAALRELEEETGLAQSPRFEPLPLELGYRRLDGAWITVHPFAVAVPPSWEPVLNEEHVDYRWCSEDAAVELLEYPEPRRALRHVARQLGAGAGGAVRVGLDISPLVQTRAGTARHVRGLVGALRGRSDLELELLSFGGPGRISSVARDTWWYSRGLARRARGLDLLHCTTFRGPVGAETPTVVTVHDLAILRHPESLPRWHRQYGRARLAKVVRAADAVVAVSEFTKAETVELLGVPSERIRVAGNGVDPVFTPDGQRAEGDYVLAVATLEPRKNLGRVVDAAQIAGVELRVVGARGWGGVDVPGWVGEIPDAELARLYRSARCVVYASLYEGFGLPALEAMASGTPAVTSSGSAMEEIVGKAAVLVDPHSTESIAHGIAEAEARRDELVPLGLARAREFTWARTADAVEALWRELA